MIHLIYGNGKGKTTSAAGLALRHAGRGGRVLFVQFLKNVPSGEVLILKKIENIDVKLSDDAKFSWNATESDIINMKKLCLGLLSYAVEHSHKYTMVVLDELLNALCGGLIGEEEILKAFEKLSCETILTGLKASERLIEKADYATCLEAVKHPYNKGISAREGIEY